MTVVDRYLTHFDLPAELAGFETLAHNLRWTWDVESRGLMADLDPQRWNETKHNPVALLAGMGPERMAHLVVDPQYGERLQAALARHEADVAPIAHDELDGKTVAYFCAEYGIHESVSLYSGGLGILAGDHLKSASDLGVPLVAVGLAYRYGYFHQRIDPEGRQAEDYHPNVFSQMPASLQCHPDGSPLMIDVPFPERDVVARIWKIMVGRVALYLLDADIPENAPEDRMITGHLYGGDDDTRVRQEILLGIGGMRALRALGIEPDAYHLNEGHSAFLIVEQIRRAMADGASYDDALATAREHNLFTTHTPVAAGNDAFDAGHVRRYLEAALGADHPALDALIELGREHPDQPDCRFSMTVAALHGAGCANGVSELHGQVARGMWSYLWPGRPESETPIGHVTNGVHMASWIAPALDGPYRDHLGEHGLTLDDAEFWRIHEALRLELIENVRTRLRRQLTRHGAPTFEIEAADGFLNPHALTIGFARRFAPYKRATLLLSDPDRLQRLLDDAERPLQILIAGKAHPRNEPGKDLMQELWRISREPRFRGKLILVEGYNIALARRLVQGVDVWLNTPRRPLEASGTSGMKAAANGAPNLSIFDGWWCEGYEKDNGWMIGADKEYDDDAQQDADDAESLFKLLEETVVPTFYDRDDDGVPRRWTAIMRKAVEGVMPQFSTARMVDDYANAYYSPCANGERTGSEV